MGQTQICADRPMQPWCSWFSLCQTPRTSFPAPSPGCFTERARYTPSRPRHQKQLVFCRQEKSPTRVSRVERGNKPFPNGHGLFQAGLAATKHVLLHPTRGVPLQRPQSHPSGAAQHAISTKWHCWLSLGAHSEVTFFTRALGWRLDNMGDSIPDPNPLLGYHRDPKATGNTTKTAKIA